MWWYSADRISESENDFTGQPPQSGCYKWGMGIVVPAALVAYGTWIVATQSAQFWGNRISMDLRGLNAVAYAVAVISAALFLHCHYFWGSIYDQAWPAVLGKIVAACGFILGLGILCVRVGILGRV